EAEHAHGRTEEQETDSRAHGGPPGIRSLCVRDESGKEPAVPLPAPAGEVEEEGESAEDAECRRDPESRRSAPSPMALDEGEKGEGRQQMPDRRPGHHGAQVGTAPP